ncbi:helix-turn-helix domain-containing protein [Jeotgalibacillus soli]|uniref:HTH cro/C1-type domain-containing protein n=1 Tax=Jeotgalibacillus soli TaxID=889306 RepID=A0A0C2VLR9_9BACL|nr:RodZ domain-containing protein [Jeotgalibacillus soli]KIL44953.1 hypothetical protein KP78_24970 [Jeotgalibacillus soli]
MTELGTRLKEAREEKGYTLEEVQALTKIQKRYLLGLEEGNYTMMPGSFYVRAFIKQYAEAVGLDPDELFETYSSDIPSNRGDEIPVNISRSQTRKAVSGSSKVFSVLPTLIAVTLIVGLLFLGWTVAQNWNANQDDADQSTEESNNSVGIDQSDDVEIVDNDDSEEEAPAVEDTSEEAPEEEPAEPESLEELKVENVNVEGETTTYQISNADNIEVSITSDRTWIGITNTNGESLISQEISGASPLTFDATNLDWFRIRVGNTTTTEVKINGQTVEFGSPINAGNPQNMVFEVQQP